MLPFFTQLPLYSLIDVCRTLRHSLAAGLSLRDGFRQLATRSHSRVRPVAERIHQRLDQGDSLEEALKDEKGIFPPLFVSLAELGERTGGLPETFGELERYYTLQKKLRNQLLAASAFPVLQLLAAPLVLAAMTFFLAILTPSGKPFDPLGFGLTGVGGAVMILVYCYGFLALVVAGFFFLTRGLKHKAAVDCLLLRIPGVGGCLEAIALWRFCMALRLTLDSSMPIHSALRLALRATGNSAYAEQADVVRKALKQGDELSVALVKARVLPDGFIHIVANAEEGGRLPEVMAQQADYYEEVASQRMTVLNRMMTLGIWLVIAGILIFLIFRMALTVFGLYDPARYGL